MSQLVANALVAAAGFMLVALSLGLVCNSSGFFNLSYAGLYTLGGYLPMAFVNKGWPLALGVALAILAIATLAMLLEMGIFARLRERGAKPEILLLASLGVLAMLQNVVSLFWGDAPRALVAGRMELGMDVMGVRLTTIQIATLVAACLVAAALGAWLRWSRMGKLLRSVASDRHLAVVCGLRVGLLTAMGAGIAGGLAVMAATLHGLDVDLTPEIGFRATLVGLVALVLGGMKSIRGVVVACIALGFLYQVSTWVLPGQWQDGIAMALLLLFLWRRTSSAHEAMGSLGRD